jgi:subtilase family serine protease
VSKDYIVASTRVDKWEHALGTKFHVFVDEPVTAKGRFRSSRGAGHNHNPYIRTEGYSLPSHLRPHVATIFNTVQAPLEMWGQSPLKTKTKTHDEYLKARNAMPSSAGAVSAASYTGASTVSFLKALYSVPTTRVGDRTSNATQSVLQLANERYSEEDLNQFQRTYGLQVQDPIPVNAVSTTSYDCGYNSSIDCYEANLDLQYIMGMAQNTTTYYWYTAGSTSDTFLAYLLEVSNTTSPPLVQSISWGSLELAADTSMKNAFNTAAMKLAAIGVTILVASGDDGAIYNTALCSYYSGSSQTDWTGTNHWGGAGYFPSFPATSPYVTAVGKHPDIFLAYFVFLKLHKACCRGE